MGKAGRKLLGKTFDRLSFGLYILVAIAILGVINWFVERYNHQLDLTPSGRYSLSLQTQRVLENLDQDVSIFVFDRDDSLPRHRYLLDSYSVLSRRVDVQLVNPDKKPSLARQLGIERYGTVIVQLGDRQQEASEATEEAITNTLIQILKGGERNVYFLQAHGERDIEGNEREGYSRVKELLEQGNYQVETLSLMQEGSIPEDCTVLIVAGPENDLLEPEIEALRSYVQGGGSAIFLLDPHRIPRLTALLGEWNVEVGENLVVDPNPIARLFGADELMPLISSYDSHVIVRDLQNVATLFPETRTIQIASDGKAEVEVQSLFKSSEQSWAASSPQPGQVLEFQEGRDTRGPFTLGVAGTLSAEEGSGTDGPNVPTQTDAEGKPEGRFVIVGTSRFAINAVIGFNGNRDLFLNMINWLSEDEDLISIRPKEPDSQRLDLNQAQMGRIRYLTLLVMPLLILAVGFSVWWGRR